MKVRTLSASRNLATPTLTAISIEEPQTHAVTTVWLSLDELQRVVSGLLAIQRTLEAEAREAVATNA